MQCNGLGAKKAKIGGVPWTTGRAYILALNHCQSQWNQPISGVCELMYLEEGRHHIPFSVYLSNSCSERWSQMQCFYVTDLKSEQIDAGN